MEVGLNLWNFYQITTTWLLCKNGPFGFVLEFPVKNGIYIFLIKFPLFKKQFFDANNIVLVVFLFYLI